MSGPEQRAQLSPTKTPDLQKRWENEHMLFEVSKFAMTFFVAIEN